MGHSYIGHTGRIGSGRQLKNLSFAGSTRSRDAFSNAVGGSAGGTFG